MPTRRRPSTISLPPPMAVEAKVRAASLALSLSHYFQILLRNYLQARRPEDLEIPPMDRTGKVIRVNVPISAPPELWAAAGAAIEGVSVSRLLEALVVRDLSRGGVLEVWPVGEEGRVKSEG